ncbi:ABC transporter permease [Bailinhaonella thermotolerans]|uniref:ABC transporter permease n=1 Tax=Bailinhaonella thermotolerans TaxID=1070861 RepID=A0A3A4A334_9ACTN|nr:ABC transporter permease [Bailinhaonella thermotolerans]
MGLSWRLLRGGGRNGLLGAGLTLAAVAVSTALLLFAVAVNLAFQGRSDREAWRTPVRAAEGTATAVQAVHQDFVRDRVIVVVDVARLSEGAPAPAGMRAFPKPGEVWMSPGLAELVKRLPPGQLGDRYGKPAGILGDDALVYPGELVAVAGHDRDDPAMKATGRVIPNGSSVPPTPVRDFAGQESMNGMVYRSLAIIASVLMVVPLLVFGGAAARLTVARRDQRLAALRLVGATPAQVIAMTVAEAMLTALGGALAGLAAYAALSPLLSGIEIGGGPWFASDLWPGVLPTLGVIAAVPLLVGVSAVVGLRRVVVSPLGVAKRETPPGMRALRLVGFVAALAVVPMLSRDTSAGIIAVVIGAAFLAINLIGPWVVGIIGRVAARTARGPARLLAARRLVDDPRAAWRTVSGVALTGFVAGFIGLASPDATLFETGTADRLRLSVDAGKAQATVREAKARLREAGLDARVTLDEPGDGPGGPADRDRERLIQISVNGGVDRVDTARTALAGLVPGHVPSTLADDDRVSSYMLGDIRTGTVVVLTVSFLIAIVSAGITAASSVLDRRQTYALLRLAGTPLAILDRARRSETLIPLLVMGGGSLATGVFCALPFASGGLGSTTGVVTLAVTVALGLAGVLGASAISRPLLRSVTANPAPRPD